VFGKFFACELFVVVEYPWYYALNHRKSIPQGVATKWNIILANGQLRPKRWV
jgi:hypothetical protein